MENLENNNNLKSTRITYIYGLYEVGKEEEIRYVGKTLNPEKRLIEHIHDNKNTYKTYWIRSITKRGGSINFKIIELTDDDNWQDREKYWINKFRNKIGNKLTNYSLGGEGVTIYDISYDECKKYLIENENIKSRSEYEKWFKSTNYNEKIPKNPREVYSLRNEWISWGDFLGTNKIQDNKIIEQYLLYDESKKWISDNLKIDNFTSAIYKKMAKNNEIPIFIPNRPERFYKKRGWISWSDFLSNDNIIQNQKKEFVSYEECKKYTNDNNIKTVTAWHNNKERPNNIPSVPSLEYKEWVDWSEFLGVTIIPDQEKAKMYLPYDECKKYIYDNLPDINSGPELRKYILDNDIKFIPLNPHSSYKNKGWVSLDSFLSKDYLSYEDAKKIIKGLNIKSNGEWRKWIKTKDKMYKNIPNAPDRYYKNEWIDWYDWLGKEKGEF